MIGPKASKPLAVATLLVGATLFTGCYYPHYYGHHRGGGWYAYGDGDRPIHRDRGHHRRHCHRHPDRCWH